ncbi:MAG: pilus assembly protein PilP [Nitrospirae bacterium]|nr:pilus assembly protein PilP [Nitrospirota bacterium]
MSRARTPMMFRALLTAGCLLAATAHAGDPIPAPQGTLADALAVQPGPRDMAPTPAAMPRPVAATAPVAEGAAPYPYPYQAHGVRDPFLPPVEVRGSQAGDGANLPDLERYPLGDFKLIGIVWSSNAKAAMVSTPDGKGFTVRAGTRIGDSNGTVRRITQDAVIVEELRTDVFGERKKFETVLALRPEEVIP